jgi:hypothetical protein
LYLLGAGCSHDVLQLGKERHSPRISCSNFDVGDGEVECRGRARTDSVFVADAKVGYGHVHVVNDGLEDFHEITAFFFFFFLGGPFGSWRGRGAQLRAARDD